MRGRGLHFCLRGYRLSAVALLDNDGHAEECGEALGQCAAKDCTSGYAGLLRPVALLVMDVPAGRMVRGTRPWRSRGQHLWSRGSRRPAVAQFSDSVHAGRVLRGARPGRDKSLDLR